MTDTQRQEWNDVYHHKDEAFQWHTDYWWELYEPPFDDAFYDLQDLNHPSNSEPWVITSGLSWGPMAGGTTNELWAWDGKEAQYIETVGGLTF